MLFRSLASLNLHWPKDIDANIYSLFDTLRCSPHLEELFLESEPGLTTEPQQPPERDIPTIPLRSLKRLYICFLLPGTIRRLLRAFDPLPNGIFMRFTGVSEGLGVIFPEGVAPEVPPRAATKVELIYPSKGGMILHAMNGVAHTRFATRDLRGRRESLPWIAEQPYEKHPLKELWLHINRDAHYRIPPLRALRNLEALAIQSNFNGEFNSTFFLLLSPDGDYAPCPVLSTLELQNVFDTETFGKVLKSRSDAGFRLRMLRIRWSDDCVARMAPLAQFVDKLEFYHVTDGASRGLELPEECMTRSRWWEPWYQRFARETATEGEMTRWGVYEMRRY